MLPLLRLSAGDAVHRRPVADRIARAADDLRLVLEIARHDGLAAGVWVGPAGVDSGDAQGAEPFDIECEFDYTESGHRSGQWPAGIHPSNDRRIPAAARLAGAGAQR